MEQCASLDQCVHNIRHEKHAHQAEYPFAAGIEVSLKAVIVLHLLRKEQYTQKEQKHSIEGDEEVEGKRPLPDALQAIFPPPKMNQVKKKKESPQQMYPIHFVLFGMLDNSSHSRQKPGNT